MLPWLPKTGKYVVNLNEKLWNFFQMRLEFLDDHISWVHLLDVT